MIRSMTAFGAAKQTSEVGTCTVELQSVNRRFLEISVSLPKELSSLEKSVKKELEKSAFRGALYCSIQVEMQEGAVPQVTVKKELAKTLAASWKELFEDLKVEGFEKALPSLLLQQEERLFVFGKNEELSSHLEPLLVRTVSLAVKEFCLMKEKEGKALAQDLLMRIEKIEKITQVIESAKETLREEAKKTLLSKVLENFQEAATIRDLAVKEVCQIVEKSDITEELVRIFSHIEQFKESLLSQEAVGRKLEFILQELLRETNTVGSKVIDLATTRLIIDVKTEIERIRQQLQNVE